MIHKTDNENLIDSGVDTLTTVPSDELTIHLKSSHRQESTMPEYHKLRARQNAPDLQDLFERNLMSGEGAAQLHSHWVSDSEVEVYGSVQLNLHKFILEAEKLGKNVEYVKTLTVKIAD